MRVRDRIVIVTGAAHGIGRATAERFAAEGAVVIATDLDEEGAGEAARAIVAAGGRASAHAIDVADRASVDRAVQATLRAHGRVDVLVNNAGILRDARLVNMSEDEFDAVIGVNLRGVFHCTQAVVDAMIEQGRGVVLNASSVVALYGNFGQTNYVAAKCGVIGMTKVWARELGPKGIRVNAVAPGFIRTRMTDSIPAHVTKRLLERVPLRTMGEPVDIANAYLWLASDEARYVTGHVLSVDGGAVV